MATKHIFTVPEPKFDIPPIDISELIKLAQEQEKLNEQTEDEKQSCSKCDSLPAER